MVSGEKVVEGRSGQSGAQTRKVDVAIIGAGPAGLTAGYLLTRRGFSVAIIEKDQTYVGGISRTVEHEGYRFDIGGHRFFSKSKQVVDLWNEILPDDFIQRPRMSRIYYEGKFYSYPLRAFEALWNLGIMRSALCMASFAQAKAFPNRQVKSFEDWTINQFGQKLYSIFFKTYTEKVWGMPCREISADWAAQRIKGLSLFQAIWRSILPQRQDTPRGAVVKTLINQFRYPRRGPGMLWEAAAEKVRRQGGAVLLGQRVVQLRRDAEGWTAVAEATDGTRHEHRADAVISSMPMRQLAASLGPAPSPAARAAAEGLRYRDFLTVALVLRDRDAFDDNWIYIHDPSVKVGRIQNFRSWSPDLVPAEGLTCYGLEYFCFEGDGLWSAEDADLLRMAGEELVKLGLARAEDITDGTVVRQPKAYPVYDDAYEAHVATLRTEIAARYPGLHLVGRNGMHKYDNQDHAMMTAMLTVENILAGRAVYDVWQVNADAEYHEEAGASGERMVPQRLRPATTKPGILAAE